MRNSYDFDFNGDGDILVYDSDMEWDTGAPWYRPVRSLMLTSGGEYGWRNGTGKWPEYYPDSLPAVANMGMGSPTGVTFGYGAKFPAKYQKAFFCMDWTYGKLYALHLTPEGAGYRGTFEPFVEGKAWDGTDVVINHDGAMYVTIGGRGTQSGLYRITYTGNEATDAVARAPETAGAEARKLRRELEQYHVKQDPKAVELAFGQLNSRDRYLRFAARVALERQDIEQWQDKAFAERRPTGSINAMIGLIRTATAVAAGHPEDGAKANSPLFAPLANTEGQREGTDLPHARGLQPKILETLNRLPLQSLSEEQQLEALRAYALCFIRLGRPTPELASPVVAKLEPLYPSGSIWVNRELVQLLAYLDVPSVVGKSMTLLGSAQTQEDQLHFVLAIRFMKQGWTPEQRKAYFSWLNHAEKNYRGGNSFRRFLQRIREDATKTLTDEEKQQLAAVIKGDSDAVMAAVVKQTAPRQFVRNWQMADLAGVIDQSKTGRNFEKGKAAFEATQCAKCHRFANEGGSSGPDLTGVGNRFQPVDVLEAILLPSKVVSDQYQTTDIVTRDGDVLVGHIEGEDDTGVSIRTNPLSSEVVTVARNNIKERRPSKVSLMPEGLMDYLTQDEVLDLIAYLRAGGSANDKAFAK
jgi:putative heme-binding domain-containing protein